MTLSQLFVLLRARQRIILVSILIFLMTAAGAYFFLPPTYRATTTLVLNYTGVGPSTGSGQLANYVTTQMDVIRSIGVARKVVETQGLTDDPELQQQFARASSGRGDIKEWAAERLLKKLDVVPGRESAVINVSFRDRDPVVASAIANAFATAYEDTNYQLKVNPMKTTAGHFSERLVSLRENLAQAQAKLSGYRKEKGITSDQEHLDVESERLSEMSRQLVAVQGQLADERSRQQGSQGALASRSQQVLNDPLTQTLKSQLNEAEARMAEISQRYTAMHPQYQSAQAEVNKRQRALQAHIRTSAGSIENQVRVLQQREGELSAAVEEQKQRVLALNHSRGELLMLNKELEDAQRAYDAASARMVEANVSGFAPPEVAILSTALPPSQPSGPGALLLMLAALIGGLIVGTGLALLAELRDRRVRSAADLFELVGLPVLGEIPAFGNNKVDPVQTPLLEGSSLKLENGRAK